MTKSGVLSERAESGRYLLHRSGLPALLVNVIPGTLRKSRITLLLVTFEQKCAEMPLKPRVTLKLRHRETVVKSG